MQQTYFKSAKNCPGITTANCAHCGKPADFVQWEDNPVQPYPKAIHTYSCRDCFARDLGNDPRLMAQVLMSVLWEMG